jgi:hypothetical protein
LILLALLIIQTARLGSPWRGMTPAQRCARDASCEGNVTDIALNTGNIRVTSTPSRGNWQPFAVHWKEREDLRLVECWSLDNPSSGTECFSISTQVSEAILRIDNNLGAIVECTLHPTTVMTSLATSSTDIEKANASRILKTTPPGKCSSAEEFYRFTNALLND